LAAPALRLAGSAGQSPCRPCAAEPTTLIIIYFTSTFKYLAKKIMPRQKMKAKIAPGFGSL